MSLSLISKTFLHSQWYQILHWSQLILCIFVSFELIFNFSSSTFWQVPLSYNGLIASNFVATNLLLRELYLWNNLCVIFMSFIDGNLTIICWKERTFINIFPNEWIMYIIRTLNFQNTFSMAFAIHSTVRRGSNVSPVFM